MAEEEYYRSSTAKYTSSAINQKSTVGVHNQQTGKMYTGPGEPEKLSGHQSSSYHILMSSHTFQREELWANFELPPVLTSTRFHV